MSSTTTAINTNANTSTNKNTRESLQALYAQRQSLEHEGQAIVMELTAPGGDDGSSPPAGIDTPLVDPDGYPRGDIDIVRVRVQRGRLAQIRNDHSRLTKEIEQHLQQLSALENPDKLEEEKREYASRRAPKPKPKFDTVTGKWVVPSWDGTLAGIPGGDTRSFDSVEKATPEQTAAALQYLEATKMATSDPTVTATSPSTTPASTLSHQQSHAFAKVNAVAADSPAQHAGLVEGDLIVQFGDLTLEKSHDAFHALAEVVPVAAEGQRAIAVTVLREVSQQEKPTVCTVQLTPRPWSGRGLLGCHLVPYTATNTPSS